MVRSPLASLVLFGLSFGSACGAIEVLLRAEPRMGLTLTHAAAFLGTGMGLGALVGALAALAAWVVGRRPHGLVIGVMAALQLAVTYRFEYVLNDFLRDPKVWGGILAFGAVGLGIGLLLDRAARPARATFAFACVSLLAGPAALLRSRPPEAAPGDGPSFLIVTLDTVRPDRLAPYGHDIETPTLSRLAAEGVVFEQAVAAAPITEPSHLAMFTGVPPIASGVVSNGTNLGERPMLVWRALQERGWATAGFVSGFPLHGKYGWTQGMDVYDDDFGAVPGAQHLSVVKAWNQIALRDHALRERSADRVLARAVPWLEAHRNDRFFAWVHLYDAHGPYESPLNAELGAPPTSGAPLDFLPFYWPASFKRITSVAWLAMAYDAEIRYLDGAVARLVDALGDRADDTVVMITADHGESLGEHDYWFDHGDNLYDPSLKVPWIVRAPGRAQAGLRPTCQVGGVDLAPTVLALAGVEDGQAREGVSRVAELGGADCRETPVFASTVAGRLVADPPTDHALRGQGHKFVLKEQGPAELYDLAADPRERKNLAPSERASQMEAAVRARAAAGTVASPELDADTRSALEALGYVDEGGRP